jgi:hypothetical protein
MASLRSSWGLLVSDARALLLRLCDSQLGGEDLVAECASSLKTSTIREDRLVQFREQIDFGLTISAVISVAKQSRCSKFVSRQALMTAYCKCRNHCRLKN